MDIKGFFLLLIVFALLWGLSSILNLDVGIKGLFLLLGMAILWRFISGRLIAIFTPKRRLRCLALGLVGGFLSSLCFSAFDLGPRVCGLNLIGAPLGVAISIFLWGLYPFLVILIRKPLR